MKTSLTAKRLREVVSYDPATGIFVWLTVNGRRTDLIGQRAGFGEFARAS